MLEHDTGPLHSPDDFFDDILDDDHSGGILDDDAGFWGFRGWSGGSHDDSEPCLVSSAERRGHDVLGAGGQGDRD